MEILVIIFSLFFIFLAVKRLDLAVMFLLFALPSFAGRFKIFGLPSTLLELMIIISFIVWMITNRHQLIANIQKTIKKEKAETKIDYPFKWEIILWLLVSFVAVGVAGFSNSALGAWRAYFFEPLLVFVLIINLFQSKIEKIILPLSFSALAVSFFAIYQKITGEFIFNSFWADAADRRVVSFFGYPNAVGLYLGPMVLLFIGWAAQKAKEKSFFVSCYLFLVSFLSVLSIYFAQSEGALVGIAVGLMIFGLLFSAEARRAIVLFLLIGAILLNVYSPAKNYLYQKAALNDFSGQIRKEIWQETFSLLKNKKAFFLGTGLAGYQKAITPYHKTGIYIYAPEAAKTSPLSQSKYFAGKPGEVWQPLETYLYPHNIFLNFWTELGLAGMILFVWICIKFYYFGFKTLSGNWKPARPAGGLEIATAGGGVPPDCAGRPKAGEIKNHRQNKKYLLIGIIAAMSVVLIHGLVDVPYFKNDLAILFWVLMAMAGIFEIEKILKKNK